jgi:hypothetical protein
VFERQPRKIFQADAQPVSLLLQKPARAGGAQRIGSHLPGLFQTVFQPYDERVVPAELDDGFGVGVVVQQPGGQLYAALHAAGELLDVLVGAVAEPGAPVEIRRPLKPGVNAGVVGLQT